MRVDGNISDLFFNSEHHADQDGDCDPVWNASESMHQPKRS